MQYGIMIIMIRVIMNYDEMIMRFRLTNGKKHIDGNENKYMDKNWGQGQ